MHSVSHILWASFRNHAREEREGKKWRIGDASWTMVPDKAFPQFYNLQIRRISC